MDYEVKKIEEKLSPCHLDWVQPLISCDGYLWRIFCVKCRRSTKYSSNLNRLIPRWNKIAKDKSKTY